MYNRAIISGIGAYVPDYILDNQELETKLATSDEWIMSRTGIKQRRILKDRNKATSYICIKAANDLIKKTNVDPLKIDLVILCTSTPDMRLTATSCHIATQIGAHDAFAFDLSAACSGFLYGLSVGAKFIESGRYKKVLVLGADKMSTLIDYDDRKTCIIFGDGGGGILLDSQKGGDYGIKYELMNSDGNGKDALNVKGGGALFPYQDIDDDRMIYFNQVGNIVFKKAVECMVEVTKKLMKDNGISNDDIDWVLMHQANIRIIDKVREDLGFDKEIVLVNIDKYGNTTNGTIPLLLWDFENKFKKGDNILLIAFGGGFTWGAMYLKWAY